MKGRSRAMQRQMALEIGAGGKLEQQFGREEIGQLSGT